MLHLVPILTIKKWNNFVYSDYAGNAYTAAVTVGGSLEGLYLSLTGAEAFTYLITGGSVAVPVFGTVLSTKDIMAAVMMASAEVSGLNVAFQLEDLCMFLFGEKPLRAPTGNQLHDASKAWTEMLSGYIATLGLQNPRTYGPTYERLPDVTLPAATNAGTSGSTALAVQNTGLVNMGGTSGAGSLALLPQMNVQAANYALAIPNVGSSVTYPVGVGGGGAGNDFGYMKNNSDPMRDVLGSGRNSNPEEWNSIIQDLENKGVEIRYREGTMAYAPGLTDGSPGQLVIDPDASLSALKHEYQHFLDAQAEGFPSFGKQMFEDPKERVIKELRAYMVEIKEADRLGLKEISQQLFENYRQEREWIINQYITVGGE